MLPYQTLVNLLRDEYLTTKGSFNGKKQLPSAVLDAILAHTAFLDYHAPMVTRVSYLLTGNQAQLHCIECDNLLRFKTSISSASKFCCIACSKRSPLTKQKRSQTVKERFGVNNIFERTDIIQAAVINKYQVDNVSQLSSTKDKISRANKKNAAARLEKTIATNLDRYGVPFVTQLESTKEKQRNTMQRRYGVDHYWKSGEFKESMLALMASRTDKEIEKINDKIKKTKLENHGDERFNNRNKAMDTMLSNYGRHCSQRHWSAEAVNIMTNIEALQQAMVGNTVNSVAEKYGIAATTLRNRIYKCNITEYAARENQYESMIESLLTKNNIEFIKNDRTILSGLELDFWLPDLALAIECNGIFWHSELMGKSRSYHLNKTTKCEQQGIKLIHLWDYQFDKNPQLVLSLLKSKLGIVATKIGARKTQIISLTSCDYRDFMFKNHLQGPVNASVRYGLKHNGILVAAMGFGKSRFNANEFELLRYATLIDISVTGGASKLLNHFFKEHTNITKLVSYANRDISTGKMYQAIGFKFVSAAPPSYLYFMNRIVYNRLVFQKHKLQDLLEKYDPSLSEWDNMVNNGFNRFWNTGNLKYEYQR